MEAERADSQSTDSEGPVFDWLDPARFRDLKQAKDDLASIWRCGATPDLLALLKQQLLTHFEHTYDLNAAVSNLSRFVAASHSPTSLLALFKRDEGALAALLQVFSTSQTLANRLIAEPSTFDLMRASDGQPAERHYLVDDLVAELETIDRSSRAAVAIRKFVSQEMVRIAYGEFVRGLAPDKVGRQLAHVADAVVEASLRFVFRDLMQHRELPRLSDGSVPQVAVIGLGKLGGEEMGYGSPLRLVFLYDQIDANNPWHRDFYSQLVRDVVALLSPDHPQPLAMDVDLRDGPKYDVGVNICSAFEAARIYETSGRVWHRMRFVKARLVAGSPDLGQSFLRRLRPWVYRRFLSRADLAEIGMLRHKLERRAEQQEHTSHDVSSDPGGRRDLEMTVQYLQLLHGGDLESVRHVNTNDAIVALQQAGCLTHQEATLLLENYARLCRLEHLLSVMFDRRSGLLPDDPILKDRLAWQLGIRAQDGSGGDTSRFDALLQETFQVNQKMINHLMLDTPRERDAVPIETELLLDPEPDPALVERTLQRHGLEDTKRAMQDLSALSTESVPFLSPHRCRHFFAALAPRLLAEIACTPNPQAALHRLVKVTDSLGAKATLWELLAANRPTMELFVRLCAAAPYIARILTENPGMVDELIDSLLMDRLPSANRLDAHSIELCRGAADIDLILHSFKNSAQLTIGVRDILGREPIESLHRALADTAEACVRRTIEHEQESLAVKYGDPMISAGAMSGPGEPDELITLALGKLGGREPNYHSDLEVVFLYSGDGETQRRVGGHRSIMTHQRFFNQLARAVVTRINHVGAGGRLYHLDSRLRTMGEEGRVAITVDEFLKQFSQRDAPLWQRLAICKARAISGSASRRSWVNREISRLIRETPWHAGMIREIRELRQRMEQTASPDNLKRGHGGTVDVELIAQTLMLRHAGESPEIIVPGTTECLAALSKAGHLDEKPSLELIHGYRVLRRIESNLRLMNTDERHELPEDQESLSNLAYLMNEADPELIIAQCKQAQKTNRRLFEQLLESE